MYEHWHFSDTLKVATIIPLHKAYIKKYLDARTRPVVLFLENKISENRKKVLSAPAMSEKLLKRLVFGHFLSDFQLLYTKIFVWFSPFRKCQNYYFSVTTSRDILFFQQVKFFKKIKLFSGRPDASKSHIFTGSAHLTIF